jgi:hypothetical protein
MKKVRWIIQDNLIAENDRNQFQQACDELGIAHYEVKVIPFSDELPEFPVDDEYENIYYGSTSFINNIYEKFDAPAGVFYDHKTFSIENYINQWGEYMLNAEADVMTVQEFINKEPLGHELTMFLRPDGDGKEFDGQAGPVEALKGMLRRMMKYESPLEMDSKIILGPAYNIQREWRNYIINGKVVTSSRYRNNFRLSKSADDIPEDMIKFVEDRCKEYQPHDVFAMDIAEVKDDGEMKYFIIECGCMNSVGFYHADIKKYVEALSNYVANKPLTVGA